MNERTHIDSAHSEQNQLLRAKRPTQPWGYDYSREEAAAFLGVSKATLDTWAWARKNLPYVKVGGRAWYRRVDLEMLLRRLTRKVVKE